MRNWEKKGVPQRNDNYPRKEIEFLYINVLQIEKIINIYYASFASLGCNFLTSWALETGNEVLILNPPCSVES